MITVIEQKILSTDPMTAVAFVYDLKEEDWKVIGAKEGELNTIIYEGYSEEKTYARYNALTELITDNE
jgi:hypothetical protein|tara:strand:+ start:605 stop:808 length:204 start_codon:yes stop_codon:yes gene_type:complete